MTLPSSGQISMGDINVELGRSRTTQISLDEAENGSIVIIRSGASPKPSATNPATISEWYGYQHTVVTAYTHLLDLNSGSGSSSTTCATGSFEGVYLYSPDSVLVVSSILYTNSTLTTIYDGFDSYWRFIDEFEAYKYAYISRSGVITSMGSCAIVDTTPPTNPSGLSASLISSTQINLSWTVSTDNVGIGGYEVERSTTNNNSGFTIVDTSYSNDYSDGTVTVNTQYWYRVRAFDTSGNFSGYSNVVGQYTFDFS